MRRNASLGLPDAVFAINESGARLGRRRRNIRDNNDDDDYHGNIIRGNRGSSGVESVRSSVPTRQMPASAAKLGDKRYYFQIVLYGMFWI